MNIYHDGDLSKYSFLVTGGAGFIGSNLVEYLMSNGAKEVRVVDNLSTGFVKNISAYISSPKFKFINGDIRNLEDCQNACKGMDIVFHQAALGSVPRSINDPITSNAVNVSGFLNMLVAARDQKVNRLVYASSSSTFGDNPKIPKSEEDYGNLLSPYAVTKRVNELYADVFGKTYGMNIIGLKYFNVFGPRQNPKGPYAAVIPLFIQSLLKGEPVFINGDGGQSRDFTFVENVVQANVKAALVNDEKAYNQIFNIALGSTISINEIFNVLKDLSKSSLNAQHREARQGDIRNSMADISKASHLLGFKPAVKVEKGLELTFEWFVKHQDYINLE